MKILKKVNVREVKRAFVIANHVRTQKTGRKYFGKVSRIEFLKKLRQSKKRGLHLTDAQLDKTISPNWSGRLHAYNSSDWYIGEVTPSEVRVWKRAGGLPLSWTNASLKKTADTVRDALKRNSGLPTKRARYAIPNILAANVGILQKEKYLLPIIFKGGTGTRGRRGLKRVMKGDIDDGCMRLIALAVHGVKRIRAYVGFPKKTKAIH